MDPNTRMLVNFQGSQRSPTLEVKFDFFYSLTKHIQCDSHGLLEEAIIYNISDVRLLMITPF